MGQELALQTEPKNADAYEILGGLDLEMGKLAEAIADFERTIRYDPNPFARHCNLGLFYLQEHDFEGALRGLRRAIGSDPQNRSAPENTPINDPTRGHSHILGPSEQASESMTTTRAGKSPH